MARKELSDKGLKDWEETLKTDSFLLNKGLIEEVKNFLKSFDSAKDEEKKELISSLVAKIAEHMNVSYSELKIFDCSNENILGSYERMTKTVKIVMKRSENSYIYSPEILTTVIHELRHAYQDQHLSRENSELGEVVRHYTMNYISSDNDKMINKIGYNTNFLEVDAQRFSFSVSKTIVEEILKNSENEKLLTRRILNVKLNRIKGEAINYEKRYNEYAEKLATYKSIFKQLKEHLISSSQVFYNAKFESKEKEKISARLTADSLSQLINSREIKEVMDISVQDIGDIYLEILSSVKAEDIAGKLNNPLTNLLESVSLSLRNKVNMHVIKDNKLIIYDDYIQKIRESIDFGKIFLDRFNIKYNKNNGRDIYLKYADNAFEYISTLLKNKSFDEFDNMLTDNISTLEIRDPVNFGRENLVKKLLNNYNEDGLKRILRENIDTSRENDVIRKFCLNKLLLDGYGDCYLAEKNHGSFSQFLTIGDVDFNKNDFDDILAKFNNYFPKFYSSCISKDELNELEDTQILNHAFHLRDNKKMIERIVETIKKQYSKKEIEKFFENQNNFAVEFLKQNDVKIEDFASSQKENEIVPEK